MASFSRKIKRKKEVSFKKDIKKTAKTIEKMVRCVSCGRVPDVIHGEKIDDWHINASSSGIMLTCPQCMEEER
jgi:transcription elongation factor Elf1